MSANKSHMWSTVIEDAYDVVKDKDDGFIRALANTLDVKGIYQVLFRPTNIVTYNRNRQFKTAKIIRLLKFY